MTNNMTYHTFEERAGTYHLVRSYATNATMARAMKPNAPRWVIFSRRATLEGFSSVGMPNGYFWTGTCFEERVMPVKPIVMSGTRA